MPNAIGNQSGFSAFPIRYANGEIRLVENDLDVAGFGTNWRHVRTWGNQMTNSTPPYPPFVNYYDGPNGYNWFSIDFPYLIQDPGTTTSLIVMGDANSTLWFDSSVGGNYIGRFGQMESLVHDVAANVFRLTRLDGSFTEFADFTQNTLPHGLFTRFVDAAGNETAVTGYSGGEIAEVRRVDDSTGVSLTQVCAYQYGTDPASGSDGRLVNILLQSGPTAGPLNNVFQVAYTYFDNYPYGVFLETVERFSWSNDSWQSLGTTYYRCHRGLAPGDYLGMLKYVLHPRAYANMVDAGFDPTTATDAELSLFADYYFEYDSQLRVTKEITKAGSMTHLFAYASSGNSPGYNSWKYKTIETRPDGNQLIVYCNSAFQVMLKVLVNGVGATGSVGSLSSSSSSSSSSGSGGLPGWYEFYEYDSNGRVILHASPSAITGYSEQYPDLLHKVGGNYEYLNDSAGLIRTYTYHEPTGWLASEMVQDGELGGQILLREYTYLARTASSSSSSSSSAGAGETTAYFLEQVIEYPDDGSSSSSSSGSGPINGGTYQIVTSYSYTWYAGTSAVQQKTTTLPVIPTGQNGSGIAATRKEYFDLFGNLIWLMNERGFLTNWTYDVATGGLLQRIDDVDSALVSNVPAGWTTPSGGGLHLVTDFEIDTQGRQVQSLGPAHSIDIDGVSTTIRKATWTVYQDSRFQVWSGDGYAAGIGPSVAYTLYNPVRITITDPAGDVTAQVQAVRYASGSSSSSSSSSGELSVSPLITPGALTALDEFPQMSYTRWTTNQYTDCCLAASTRVYHTIPASGEGASGTNYDETDYGYDVMKRRNRTVTPGGTITDIVYDLRGNAIATYVGTNDDGATESDPTGGGANPNNNMVIVTANEFDGGADGGDGNLTQQTQYASASDTRITTFTYDFRDRRITTDGEVDAFAKVYYDNLDRVVKSERYNTTSGGNLIARSETKFDPRGQVYLTVRYGVDPSTGTVGNSLTDNTWFDAAGNVIKSLPAGSDLFTKSVYDSLGRTTTQYIGYDTAETSYSDAGSVTDDVILEQSETTYDAASNVLQTTSRQRYHNAPASQLGALGDPSTTPKARVTYMAQWADALGRTVASANYGTNGGSALSRPSSIPSRSDTVLVTSTVYDSAGNVESTTDPAGMATSLEYDDRGRETAKVRNPTSSSSSSSSSGGCSPSDDTNITVQTAYNSDGNVSSITAVNGSTGNQVTQYVYGSTLSDSEIASSLLKVAEIYPDSVGGSDQTTFAYNRQQQVTQATDQGGTVHAYDYDKLGRQTQDRITTLGSGVDGAIRRIATTYEVRGMKASLTSYDNPAVGSGSVVNDVQFAYNDFGQLTTDYQSHSGAVNVSTTPKVQYGYADGATNTIRPTTLTYPNGRVLTFSYGTSGGISDHASRVASLIDNDGTTHLVDYDYLGRGTFVVADDTQPDVKWTLVDLSGSNDPDTGDIYSGLDRFGRVKDNRWYDYGSSTDADRIKYGYDRAGNRIWRENTVATSLSKEFDELYSYDAVHRLQDMQRGTLNSGHTALTSETFAQCWTLDSTGNWSGFRQDDTGDGTWDLVQARTANPVNEITDITNSAGSAWVDPAYSAAGNMTTMPQPNDPTQSYTATYDTWNRLVKLVDGSNTVSEYAYDGAKRRVIQKTYSGGSLSETRHLYYTQPSQWQVVEERVDSSSNAQRQFVWGPRYIDDCVLRDRDTTGGGTLDERLYACQDANWNVDAIVDTAGEVQELYAYSAYGVPTFLTPLFGSRSASSYGWESLYCGYRFETGTEVFHVRNRIYLTPLGTWGQRDPLSLAAGTHLYQYCSSRTTSRTDPSGLIEPVTCTILIIGGVIIIVGVSGCSGPKPPPPGNPFGPGPQPAPQPMPPGPQQLPGIHPVCQQFIPNQDDATKKAGDEFAKCITEAGANFNKAKDCFTTSTRTLGCDAAAKIAACTFMGGDRGDPCPTANTMAKCQDCCDWTAYKDTINALCEGAAPQAVVIKMHKAREACYLTCKNKYCGNGAR